MMHAARRVSCCLMVALLSVAAGCGDDDGDPGQDASAVDSGVDGSATDGGVDGGDAGTTVPLAGFGDISGHCGVLDDAEWDASDPFLFRNAIDFGTQAFDASALTPGGQQIWVEGNLGGDSLHSEIFAYEVLQRCELAVLLKTEGTIEYVDVGGKKTDLLVTIDGRRVGVSVTRAFHWPTTEPMPLADAETLLVEKLGDILLSAVNAKPVDAWERSMLSVIAYNAQHADVIETAYASLDASLTDETILLITVTDGQDDYLY